MAEPAPLKVRWLDANHRVLRAPIYIGSIIPGKVSKAYIYIENLDKRTEDIEIWCEPEWVRVLQAPRILDNMQRGKVILELHPPYDLDDDHTTIRLYGTGNKVKII